MGYLAGIGKKVPQAWGGDEFTWSVWMSVTKKMYYSISEVCAMTTLEPHVLRYWESEFSQLRPKKNRAGNRAYRDKDIEVIEYIKYLLYEEQYTIPGAKKKCAQLKTSDKSGSGNEPQDGDELEFEDEHEAVAPTESVNPIVSSLKEVLAALQA
jgi:DNA-binding transcriptional MerR regulator